MGKTIEKPSMSMVNLQKNIQWWWSGGSKTIEKPSLAMVPWNKNITIASFEKNYHRWSLQCGMYYTVRNVQYNTLNALQWLYTNRNTGTVKALLVDTEFWPGARNRSVTNMAPPTIFWPMLCLWIKHSELERKLNFLIDNYNTVWPLSSKDLLVIFWCHCYRPKD